MPDVYATIEHAAESVQERLADVLELRAADLQQRAMLEEYLKNLHLPAGARILEIGCGTGAVARVLARRPDVSEVVGLDPGSVFIEQARRRAEGLGRLSFVTGDGRDLPFDDSSFDAVVCHTALCHIPGPGARARRGPARRSPDWPARRVRRTITPPPRSPSPITIRSRYASRPRSRPSCTTGGWSAASQR